MIWYPNMTHDERLEKNPSGIFIEGYEIDFSRVPQEDAFMFSDYKRAMRAKTNSMEVERQLLAYVTGIPFKQLADMEERDYFAIEAGMRSAMFPGTVQLLKAKEKTWQIQKCECECECSYCAYYIECVKCDCEGKVLCTFTEVKRAQIERSFINKPGGSVFSWEMLIENVIDTPMDDWTLKEYRTVRAIVEESLQSPLSPTQAEFLSS